jgi:poly(3-hydroxyalkanoate) synthetase
MKKKTGQYIIASILLLLSFNSFSQQSTPAWVSDKGYWVIESNRHQHLQYIVRFYNNDNIMTGTIEINGTKLNVKKTQVKMELKFMLEASLAAYAASITDKSSTDLAKKP